MKFCMFEYTVSPLSYAVGGPDWWGVRWGTTTVKKLVNIMVYRHVCHLASVLTVYTDEVEIW